MVCVWKYICNVIHYVFYSNTVIEKKQISDLTRQCLPFCTNNARFCSLTVCRNTLMRRSYILFVFRWIIETAINHFKKYTCFITKNAQHLILQNEKLGHGYINSNALTTNAWLISLYDWYHWHNNLRQWHVYATRYWFGRPRIHNCIRFLSGTFCLCV